MDAPRIETWDHYQQVALSTASRPALSGVRWVYPALGLAGEASELLDKVEQQHRGIEIPTDELIKELGDVAWYIANTAHELGLSLGAIAAESNLPALGQTYAAATPSLLMASCRLCAASGRLAELFKKAIRDDGGAIDAARQTRLSAELGTTLARWLDTAQLIGVEPAAVLQANANKLASRKARGVLGGDGDNR